MKNKKRYIIIILLLFFALGVFSTPSEFFVKANSQNVDNGYVINKYFADVKVNLDNSYTVTETLTAQFYGLEHGVSRGIYRYIPQKLTMQKYENGKTKTITYNAEIDLLDAYIAENPLVRPEDVFYKDNNLVVLIRENNYVNGKTRNYVFKYKYKVGYDRDETQDFVYYNLLGTSINTKVENFEFSLTMPSVESYEIKPALTAGRYGTTTNSLIVYDVSEYNNTTTITGHSTAPLKAFEGVTLKINLPNNYFSEVKKFDKAIDIVILVVSVVILFGVFWYTSKKRDKTNPVEVVEFYPPDDMDPVKLAYTINGFVTFKNLSSLIVYWASKGYIFIEDNKNELSLIKLKDLSNDAPQYQKIIFEAIFDNSKKKPITQKTLDLINETLKANIPFTKENDINKINVKNLAGTVGKDMTIASQIATVEFGKRVKSGAIFKSFLIKIVSIIPVLLFMLMYYTRTNNSDLIGMAVLIGLLYLITSVVYFGAYNKILFSRRSSKTILKLIGFVLPVVAIGLMLYIFNESIVDKLGLKIVTIIVAYLGIYLSTLLPTLNSEYKSLYGRVLGFRKHIIVAEENRMKVLMKENPSYFYDILPYAYVLGITNEFINQFENIGVESPIWYSSTNLTGFDLFVFGSVINTSLNSIRQNLSVVNNPTTSGKGFGGFGGGGIGGGGFSGGGFGGGGVGRA